MAFEEIPINCLISCKEAIYSRAVSLASFWFSVNIPTQEVTGWPVYDESQRFLKLPGNALPDSNK